MPVMPALLPRPIDVHCRALSPMPHNDHTMIVGTPLVGARNAPPCMLMETSPHNTPQCSHCVCMAFDLGNHKGRPDDRCRTMCGNAALPAMLHRIVEVSWPGMARFMKHPCHGARSRTIALIPQCGAQCAIQRKGHVSVCAHERSRCACKTMRSHRVPRVIWPGWECGSLYSTLIIVPGNFSQNLRIVIGTDFAHKLLVGVVHQENCLDCKNSCFREKSVV